ncbi:MAG: non-homologous end joining protein Ku [Nitrosomonas sp.]
MTERAFWSGHMRLSLVTFPIRLFPATSARDKIVLHKYDRDSGQRIRYQNVDEKGEPVDPEDIIRGYEYEKGSFVPIEDQEIDNLKLESKHTIELVQFTDLASIDSIYFDAPYYVVPDGDIAQEAYLTLRDALRMSRKVALGQIMLRDKERIVAIKPCGKGLLMETLRYAYEVRQAEDYFDGIDPDAEIDDEQLALAEELINRKTAKFDPKKFKDVYQEGLKEIVNAKLGKRPVRLKKEPAAPEKVTNIMDALRRSLKQASSSSHSGSDKRKPIRKTRSTKQKTVV